LFVIYETNLLSLVNPLLNNIYQIQKKNTTVSILQKIETKQDLGCCSPIEAQAENMQVLAKSSYEKTTRNWAKKLINKRYV